METSPNPQSHRGLGRIATLAIAALALGLSLAAGGEPHDTESADPAPAAAPSREAPEPAVRKSGRAVASVRSELSGSLRAQMAEDLRAAFDRSQREISAASELAPAE